MSKVHKEAHRSQDNLKHRSGKSVVHGMSGNAANKHMMMYPKQMDKMMKKSMGTK